VLCPRRMCSASHRDHKEETRFSDRKWPTRGVATVSFCSKHIFKKKAPPPFDHAPLHLNNRDNTMFKKAKRANFRRRNESDEDDQEEGRQPAAAPTPSGPVAEEIPFMETASVGCADTFQSNGVQATLYGGRPVKKEKKAKDIAVVPAPVAAPTKAILLSFDDDDGELAR